MPGWSVGWLSGALPPSTILLHRQSHPPSPAQHSHAQKHFPPSTSMAPPRRQSTVKAVPQASAPSTSQTPTPRPTFAPPTTSPSTLKIHPLLEAYEATISALIGALSDDPFRVEAIHNYTNRLLQCEKDLEDALEEGTTSPCALWGGFVGWRLTCMG